MEDIRWETHLQYYKQKKSFGLRYETFTFPASQPASNTHVLAGAGERREFRGAVVASRLVLLFQFPEDTDIIDEDVPHAAQEGVHGPQTLREE